MVRVMAEVFGWLNILVAAAGVVVTTLCLGRSKWVPLLLGGFGVEAAMSVFYRLRAMGGVRGMDEWQFVYVLSSIIYLAARAAIVAGVAGLLWERRGQAAGIQGTAERA
jgi:hypothetical protein